VRWAQRVSSRRSQVKSHSVALALGCVSGLEKKAVLWARDTDQSLAASLVAVPTRRLTILHGVSHGMRWHVLSGTS
jgi:hypothetical protein